MKRSFVVTFLFLFVLSVHSQEFVLTDNGFLDVKDNSKNYVVIEVPGKSKEELYLTTKKYINTLYNSPKFVVSDIENEQIVVDAIGSEIIKVIFRLNGSNLWQLNYKYVIDFKDGRLRFSPIFKSLSNTEDSQEIMLIGISALGNATGIFNEKGKILREKAKLEIESQVSEYLTLLKDHLLNVNSEENDNW